MARGRQREQSLLESRARLAGIVQSATDAIVVLDERLRIVFFNAAADRMFGGPDQPIGSHIERFVAPRFHRAIADGVDSLRRKDNQAGSVGVRPGLCGLRTNGDEFLCEASIAPYAIDGSQEFAIFIRDITERTQSEEMLRRRIENSEERFRLIASTAPVIIWMSDADQQGTYINEAWTSLTGLPQEAALGDRWGQAIHPDDLDRCVETYTHGFNRREPFQMEYRLRRNDGEFRWIFAQGIPRYDAAGSFAGFIGSAIDVTERKEGEELLSSLSQRLIEAQEQERSRLARELHDDINQQIAVLVLSLEIAMKHLGGPPSALREQIGSAIDTATSLAADVQSLSHRLHSSRLQTLGLELAAREVCREFSERSGVVIQFRSADVATGVGAQVGLCLYRVLQEALQNAVKHSGATDIEVSLEIDGNAITLTVRDSGIGFEPAKAFKGKGLGLVSMKERLKLVDGKLSIEGHSPRGTTIRARVPLDRRHAARQII